MTDRSWDGEGRQEGSEIREGDCVRREGNRGETAKGETRTFQHLPVNEIAGEPQSVF